METAYTKPEGLSPQEHRILALFRATDSFGRKHIRIMAEVQVQLAPERAAESAPQLRLVKGGES